MNAQDMLNSLRRFWKDFSRERIGIAGLVLLVAFILLGIFGTWLVPFPGAVDHWRDIAFWQDNPRAAPPAWVNWFSARKGAVSLMLREPSDSTEESQDGLVRHSWTFGYKADFSKPPRDMIVRVTGLGQVPVLITVTRPDGISAELWRGQLDLAEGGLSRVSLERDCTGGITELLRVRDESLASSVNLSLVSPLAVLFADYGKDMTAVPTMLKGEYSFRVEALVFSEEFRVDQPEIMVSGDVSGILGTDVSKRDVFTGLIIGIRWALVIGLLTSIITVLVGVFFGVIAAYFGGATDWLLNRLFELIYLMPVLPFLIVISAIFKPTIWTLIIIICLFFWSGPFRPAYSMALQIKEETYIEAARGIGSGRWRIVARHIVPILLPYSFAVMALSIPGVIVYEASVSLLGLGDATIVTWGQILNDALNQGAVINNLWWWVVPPGLMIALMGMSFAFLGTALDKILHPKLKTR